MAHLGANGAGQVSEIDTGTNTLTTSAAVGADPIGMAVDASGTNVFVVNYGADTVTAASTADLTRPGGPAGGRRAGDVRSAHHGGRRRLGRLGAVQLRHVLGQRGRDGRRRHQRQYRGDADRRDGGRGHRGLHDAGPGAAGGAGGVDYTITSGTLTFAAGVTSLTFPVPILNDNLPEGNERFEVVLSNPSAGARLGSTSISKVTIQDDEVVLQFDATAYTVSEDGTKATITVERSGPPGSTVTVQYATSNGTATGGATAATLGADYVTTSGTLTFGPTITTQTFTVTIVNDFVIEPDETLTLTLSNPGVVGTGTAPILGPRNPATLTITNDDKAGTIEFSAGTYTASEAAGTAAIVVSRTGGLAEGVTVTFATSAGTATPGDDYTETATTLTFAGGEAIKTVLVPIVNDSIVEPNETVSLTLSSPGGGGTLGARSTAVLTIISDDQPGDHRVQRGDVQRQRGRGTGQDVRGDPYRWHRLERHGELRDERRHGRGARRLRRHQRDAYFRAGVEPARSRPDRQRHRRRRPGDREPDAVESGRRRRARASKNARC